MKPTRAQYFFANLWPVRVFVLVWFVGGPVTFAYLAGGVLAQGFPLSNLVNLIIVVFFTVVALVIGLLLALIGLSLLAGILWPLLRPLFNARALKNGAPFQVGDHVRILAGRHKDRIVRVYDVWKEDQVRVELGQPEREKFDDIFSDIQLLRHNVQSAGERPESIPLP